MGNQSDTNPGSPDRGPWWMTVLLLLVWSCSAGGQASTPLVLPSGLIYDAAGNLYFAEAGNHVVRKLTPGGMLTVFAGTGVQGFSGEGGPALGARLDSPGAVAVDSAGNLLIADTHNHRIRRVEFATGLITTVVGTGVAGSGAEGVAASASMVDLPTALAFDAAGNLFYADGRRQVVRRVDHSTGQVRTVAGNGVQGSQGDGGPALAASLDSPAGLAVDAVGNVFVSDSHNQRVRRLDAATGGITNVAGNGKAGFSPGAAAGAGLTLPRGLAVDASGTLFIVDAGNHRLRRVEAGTGLITTIAGGAAQGFAGDGGAAAGAALDSPRGITLAPGGLPTLADTGNNRVRQVDGAGAIRTIAGSGAKAGAAGLTLSGPVSVVYGGGSLSASLGGGAGVGSVRLLEGSAVVGSAVLVGDVAIFSTGALAAGGHVLQASFTGDAGHGPLQSNLLSLAVTRAPAVATPDAVTVVYGTVVPALSGTLTGVLAQDAGLVQVGFSSAATLLSGAGSYPVTATLSGSAAGNYALTTVPGALTVTKAPSSLTLTSGLLAHVGSGTAGQPGGAVTLLDGNAVFASVIATAAGDAQFSAGGLSNGSHTLSALYAGDANFMASAATPVVVTIGPVAGADFAIAVTGPSAMTVNGGNSVVFTFAEMPVNGGLSSPIVLDVSGLPSGATATFSPAYLPPGSGAATFTLTVHTLKMAGLRSVAPLVLAGLFLLVWAPRRRRRGLLVCWLLVGLAGCGDRVNTVGQGTSASRTYNLTVNGTGTGTSGAVLLHSVPLTLTIQ